MTSTEKKAPSKKEESVFDWLKTLPPREGNISHCAKMAKKL